MCVTPVLQDISSIYQIFTDEVLGSGQFGVVYKGAFMSVPCCCWSTVWFSYSLK